jgi:hypothetical protein
MFARILNVSMNGVARVTVGAIVLIVGSACNKGPDNCDCGEWDSFAVTARGANVLPEPIDTTPEGFGRLNTAYLTWTFTVTHPPASGTIDSIAIYAMAANATDCTITTCSTTSTPAPGATNSIATAILCAGAAGCAAGSGEITLVGTVTREYLNTLLRAYGGQLIVFTTTVRSGGVMRGTPYLDPF